MQFYARVINATSLAALTVDHKIRMFNSDAHNFFERKWLNEHRYEVSNMCDRYCQNQEFAGFRFASWRQFFYAHNQPDLSVDQFIDLLVAYIFLCATANVLPPTPTFQEVWEYFAQDIVP